MVKLIESILLTHVQLDYVHEFFGSAHEQKFQEPKAKIRYAIFTPPKFIPECQFHKSFLHLQG